MRNLLNNFLNYIYAATGYTISANEFYKINLLSATTFKRVRISIVCELEIKQDVCVFWSRSFVQAKDLALPEEGKYTKKNEI